MKDRYTIGDICLDVPIGPPVPPEKQRVFVVVDPAKPGDQLPVAWVDKWPDSLKVADLLLCMPRGYSQRDMVDQTMLPRRLKKRKFKGSKAAKRPHRR